MRSTFTKRNLSLAEYFESEKFHIANERNWECSCGSCPDKSPNCTKNCLNNALRSSSLPNTMNTYKRYMEKLEVHMDKVPICKISLDQLRKAMALMQESNSYELITMETVQSCVRIILRYAERKGHGHNVLKYLPKSSAKSPCLLIMSLKAGKQSTKNHNLLRAEHEKMKYRQKSLSIYQQEKLGKLLDDSVLEDGRYCILAILLYCGVRPAEGRAVYWKDIISFLDHPERRYIVFQHIREKTGVLKDRMKTKNAYRSIPEHIELRQILLKRYSYVAKLAEEQGKCIDDLPVGCYKNEIDRPCMDYEVAILADKVFHELGVGKEVLYMHQVDMLYEQVFESDRITEENQHLTLYVLRRNFWTCIMSCTKLSDLEKRLIMGHDMTIDRKDYRKLYNDEDRLWEICQQMDNCIINSHLHEPILHYTLTADHPIVLKDQGIAFIDISKEMLQRGGTVHFSLQANEPASSIMIRKAAPSCRVSGLDFIGTQTALPAVAPSDDFRIIRSYENWQAHQRNLPRQSPVQSKMHVLQNRLLLLLQRTLEFRTKNNDIMTKGIIEDEQEK